MAKTLRTSGDYTIKAGDGFNSGSGANTITLDSLNVSVSGASTVTGDLTVGGDLNVEINSTFHFGENSSVVISL